MVQYIYHSTAVTDRGLQKPINEDCYFESSQLSMAPDILRRLGYVYAVADGVSGQMGGEIASRIAVDTLRMYYVLPHVTIPALDRLQNVFSEAHRRIEEYGESHPEYRGMGTTMTTIVLQDRTLFYGHVGDSRLYLLHTGSRDIHQLTDDHTLLNKFVKEGKLTPEEAAQEDNNVLEQALGCVTNIRVDTGEYTDLKPGDIILLTSDGLTDLVSDAKIRDIILSAPSLPDAGQRLIETANHRGGKDNITVILIGLEENSQDSRL